MDHFLDLLYGGLKSLEGRLLPKGWSAAVVAAAVVGFGALLVVIACLVS